MKNNRMRLNVYLLVTLAVSLAFFVVVLGAYTRLTNAGLGCPDWPGCYGHVSPMNVAHTSFNSRAAWTEMLHRYCAGTVGILILIMSILAWQQRQKDELIMKAPLTLLVLVTGQALLGMWTVTLKLHPVIVMAHLMGGLTTLALLWRYRLLLDNRFRTTLSASEKRWKKWARMGLCVLILQIALGGWVSANYAGLACVGFPTCNGVLLPSMDILKAFSVSGIGPNYQGGLLESHARVTIQLMHRIGAIITATYLLGLATQLLRRARSYRLRKLAMAIIVLTCCQFALGIANVVWLLPLSVAVLHNATAASLLLVMVTLISATTANREEWFHA